MIPSWLARDFAEGPVSFEHFMERALFHPSQGYYTAGIQSVGRGGDFSTSATLSAALAEAIASWICHEAGEINLRRPYQFIELGPGDGSLAREVIEFLPWSIRRTCKLHLVEVSKPLRELQAKTLRKHQRRTTWHSSLKAALRAIPEDTFPFLFSNEFFDAFPVRVFRGADELFLTFKSGVLEETWLPAKNRPDSTVFAPRWPAGQRLEVAESAHQWLADALPSLRRGAVLTIDYGGNPKEIYHRKPHGTLRGYLLHQTLTGPELYQNPGRQDLTADVNFEDLQSVALAHGLETESLLTQAEFLAPFLNQSSAADRFLADPHGAGAAFKVLMQRKV